MQAAPQQSRILSVQDKVVPVVLYLHSGISKQHRFKSLESARGSAVVFIPSTVLIRSSRRSKKQECCCPPLSIHHYHHHRRLLDTNSTSRRGIHLIWKRRENNNFQSHSIHIHIDIHQSSSVGTFMVMHLFSCFSIQRRKAFRRTFFRLCVRVRGW